MVFRRIISVFLVLCILSTCLISCKKEESLLLHSEDIALKNDCEHNFTVDTQTEENCVITTIYKCETCLGLRTEYKNSLGHNVIFDPGKTATCRGNGYSNGIYCKTCEKVHSEKAFMPLDSSAHYFINEVETATVYEGTKTYSKCALCSKKELLSTSDKTLSPEEIGVPVLMFEGNLEASTKEKPVNMTVSYKSKEQNFTSYCTMKVQGNTSAEYEKKNYNIKLYSDEAHTQKNKVDLGWGEEFKYCLKANYIDASHARNIVNARLFAKITQTRTGYEPRLDGLANMGLIDGFPVALYLNGEFYGMYTLNIPKDKWLLGMKNDESVKEAILMADDWQPSVYLKEPIAANYSNGWDLEHCTTQNSAWVRNSFNEFIEFVKTADDQTFKSRIEEYIDLDSFIDTMLFYVAIGAYDNYVKNMLYVTYDGGDTWICVPYDLDSTWGLYWDGTKYVSTDIGMPHVSSGTIWFDTATNLLFPKFFTLFKDEMKARYKELREGVFSNQSIKDEFTTFFESVPEALYKSDYQRWPDSPKNTVNQEKQIFEYVDARLKIFDDFMNKY